MIHHGRCGSTVVADLLKQHCEVFWADELYTSVFEKWLNEKNNKNLRSVTSKTEDPIDILKSSMNKSQKKHYGFEIKPFHFRYINGTSSEFLNKLYSLNFTHFIILRRKNMLRSLVSNQVAEHKNYYFIGKEKTAEIKNIYFNIKQYGSLSRFISEYEDQLKQFEKQLKEKNILKINYEKHIEQSPYKAYSRICKFINIKPEEADIVYAKTNPFPLADIVQNMDEVADALHNTPHEWMLKKTKFSQISAKVRYAILRFLKSRMMIK